MEKKKYADFPGNIQHDIKTNCTRKSDAKAVSTFSCIIAWFERHPTISLGSKGMYPTLSRNYKNSET